MQKFFWPLSITISFAVIWQFSSVPVILCSQWTLKTRFNTKICSVLASSKFMEQFFVKCFILVFRSCGEEDVTTNEFMDHLAVTAQTTEGYWHTLVKLYGHLESHVKDEKRFRWRFVESGDIFLTCLISQFTFHCFMLANLHVVTGSPVDMSIRNIRLYEIPRISSFLLPLNLKPK